MSPSLNTQSLANFEIRGWAVNKIKLQVWLKQIGDIHRYYRNEQH